MRATTLFLACFLFSVSLTTINAQQPTAQVQLDCVEESIALDAYPGAESNTILVHCLIANPTSGEEKVEFNGSWGQIMQIDFVDGHEFIIPAGGEVEANVSVTIVEGSEYASYNFELTAEVLELNGIPPMNTATDSVNVLVDVVQFDSYSTSYNSPLSFTVVLNDATLNTWDGITIQNNGNAQSQVSLVTDDLSDDLGAHNLSVVIPVVSNMIAIGDSWNANLGVGVLETATLDTSDWEELDNGARRLNLSSTIGLQGSSDVYCHECSDILDVDIEILVVEEALENSNDENDENEDESEEVPFVGFFATLSVVCLAFALYRNDTRCLDEK
jgi:hypothetical protein